MISCAGDAMVDRCTDATGFKHLPEYWQGSEMLVKNVQKKKHSQQDPWERKWINREQVLKGRVTGMCYIQMWTSSVLSGQLKGCQG